MTYRITVFGGSQPNPGDPVYSQGLYLGRLIAEAGYIVLTGGYIGTMEAVSRGAAEAGGHVFGVTCDEIEAWRPVKPNSWLTEELRFPTLRLRLSTLIDQCDGALALPGGVGTLAEITLMWNQLLTAAIPPRPLITIGTGWQSVFDQLYFSNGCFIPEVQRQWLHHAPNVETAFHHLQEMLSSGKV
jgi:uncharacterized protein (TIGR00725 family)